MREWIGRTGPGRLQRARGAVAAVLATGLFAATASAAAAGEGDPAAGEKLYRACKACHEIGEGARNRVGPHLDGIIGRTAGALDGFKFSGAMRKAGEEGLVWTAETLDAYLEKPREFIPGNRMSFRGMNDAGDRADLIAWLTETATAAPAADPAASDGHDQVRGFADIVLAIDGDPDYGEYLAGECVTCHQETGRADGIPSIVGLPKDYFVRALFEYKTNVRLNEVMKLRVANLGNEEIAALAAYYSSLEPE